VHTFDIPTVPRLESVSGDSERSSRILPYIVLERSTEIIDRRVFISVDKRYVARNPGLLPDECSPVRSFWAFTGTKKTLNNK